METFQDAGVSQRCQAMETTTHENVDRLNQTKPTRERNNSRRSPSQRNNSNVLLATTADDDQRELVVGNLDTFRGSLPNGTTSNDATASSCLQINTLQPQACQVLAQQVLVANDPIDPHIPQTESENRHQRRPTSGNRVCKKYLFYLFSNWLVRHQFCNLVNCMFSIF